MATDRFGKDLYVRVEQASHCQQQFRALPLLLTFQNIPGVGMTNGSEIPPHMPKIEIYYAIPIFKMETGVVAVDIPTIINVDETIKGEIDRIIFFTT